MSDRDNRFEAASDIETLKKWVAWTRKTGNGIAGMAVSSEENDAVLRAIENTISQVGSWKAKHAQAVEMLVAFIPVVQALNIWVHIRENDEGTPLDYQVAAEKLSNAVKTHEKVLDAFLKRMEHEEQKSLVGGVDGDGGSHGCH